MDSKTIYNTLCVTRKSLIESYKPYSGLHRHHIIPKHSGGKDDESNYTYLTVREHILAHYLLWRIYKNPNDLRAMHMLGGNLSTTKRIITGEYCRDNKLGFHGASKEQLAIWRERGLATQRASGSKNTFTYWASEEGRKERASLGGKASIESGNNTEFLYWMSPEGRKKRASLGGKAHKGKRCMYKPGDKSFKRIKPEDIQSYLDNGYIFGSPHKTNHRSN